VYYLPAALGDPPAAAGLRRSAVNIENSPGRNANTALLLRRSA
jgi:hypothetical protein